MCTLNNYLAAAEIVAVSVGAGVAAWGVIVAKKALSSWKDVKMFEKTEDTLRAGYEIVTLTDRAELSEPKYSDDLQDQAAKCTQSLNIILAVLTIYITNSSLDKKLKKSYLKKVKDLMGSIIDNPVDHVSLNNNNADELHIELKKRLGNISKDSIGMVTFIIENLANMKK